MKQVEYEHAGHSNRIGDTNAQCSFTLELLNLMCGSCIVVTVVRKGWQKKDTRVRLGASPEWGQSGMHNVVRSLYGQLCCGGSTRIPNEFIQWRWLTAVAYRVGVQLRIQGILVDLPLRPRGSVHLPWWMPSDQK